MINLSIERICIRENKVLKGKNIIIKKKNFVCFCHVQNIFFD